MATQAVTSYQPEQADLFYCEGRSDKTYSIQLSESEAGWAVTVQYGRRGSAQQADTKIERAEYEAAKRIYDKTLTEKLGKGYQYLCGAPDPHAKRPEVRTQFVSGKVVKAEPLSVSAPVSKQVLFSPELLTRCTENELLAYMRNPRYWFQLKRDGRRLTIQTRQIGKDKWDTIAYNKLGQAIQIDADPLRKSVENLCYLTCSTSALLDGEIEASGFHIWDILELDHDMRGVAYENRFYVLAELLKGVTKKLFLVRTAKTTSEKEKLLGWAKANRAEGIVVKDRYAVYAAGRNGSHLKHKFESTASFIVGPKPPRKENDGHRSVALYVVDRGYKGGERWKLGANTDLRFVCTCKVADKYKVPAQGSVIEARYLYAFKNGGVYQPCYFGVVRTDVNPADCSVQQLRIKAEAE
jgi:bifunctional non-homologous end joining protein LigD